MGTFVLFASFVSALGVSLGGMLTSRRGFSHQSILFSIAILFLFLCYIGALIGGYLFSWLAVNIIQIFIGITLIILVVFLLIRFHPSLGYFHGEDKMQWAILFFLFLLIGMEFATLEISNWLLIIVSAIFLGSLIAGAAIIFRLILNMRIHPVTVLIPAVLLVFLGVFKVIS